MKCDSFPQPNLWLKSVVNTSTDATIGFFVRWSCGNVLSACSNLSTQMPAASAQLIKKVLAEMKRAGQVRLVGRGRGVYWENAGPRKAP